MKGNYFSYNAIIISYYMKIFARLKTCVNSIFFFCIGPGQHESPTNFPSIKNPFPLQGTGFPLNRCCTHITKVMETYQDIDYLARIRIIRTAVRQANETILFYRSGQINLWPDRCYPDSHHCVSNAFAIAPGLAGLDIDWPQLVQPGDPGL